MLELYGKGVSNGIAIGRLSFYSNSSNNVPKYSVTDTSAELKRYKNASKSAKLHLQMLYDEACKRVSAWVQGEQPRAGPGGSPGRFGRQPNRGGTSRTGFLNE